MVFWIGRGCWDTPETEKKNQNEPKIITESWFITGALRNLFNLPVDIKKIFVKKRCKKNKGHSSHET